MLDDVLTGLDRTTEAAVLEAVFNEDGILKNTGSTIVLATNSGMLTLTHTSVLHCLWDAL